MAFQSKDLSVLAYANGFTLWHYVTPDATATATADDYFAAAADMMNSNDLLILVSDTGGTPSTGFWRLNVSPAGVGVTAL